MTTAGRIAKPIFGKDMLVAMHSLGMIPELATGEVTITVKRDSWVTMNVDIAVTQHDLALLLAEMARITGAEAAS